LNFDISRTKHFDKAFQFLTKNVCNTDINQFGGCFDSPDPPKPIDKIANLFMSVIYILIFCSMLVAAGFLGAFLWATKKGQFDDDYTPSVRILFEDEIKPDTTCQNKKK
jgi:cbb3-type cytochrome oxidase maturation protein